MSANTNVLKTVARLIGHYMTITLVRATSIIWLRVLDFPQDRSADTHDCGTRLGDVAKPADVSVPFGHSDGRQTVRAANAEFHGSTFLTGSAGKSKILKILCDGKVSKDTQWKDIEKISKKIEKD